MEHEDDIIITLDMMMLRRRMSLNELAEKVGIDISNLSLIKNNHIKAIRFSTLKKICRALECQPGDILIYKEDINSKQEPERTGKTVRPTWRDVR